MTQFHTHEEDRKGAQEVRHIDLDTSEDIPHEEDSRSQYAKLAFSIDLEGVADKMSRLGYWSRVSILPLPDLT
jgi:hypothetical protein